MSEDPTYEEAAAKIEADRVQMRKLNIAFEQAHDRRPVTNVGISDWQALSRHMPQTYTAIQRLVASETSENPYIVGQITYHEARAIDGSMNFMNGRFERTRLENR